jgi:hypothetical protein
VQKVDAPYLKTISFGSLTCRKQCLMLFFIYRGWDDALKPQARVAYCVGTVDLDRQRRLPVAAGAKAK